MTSVPAWAFGIVAAGIFSLMSVIWVQVNLRMKKLEDWKVDKGHCSLKEQLAKQEFEHGRTRMDDLRSSIHANHDDLKLVIGQIQKDQRNSTESMAEMNKCLALLSEKISCEPKTK
jgi:hypothetical protein